MRSVDRAGRSPLRASGAAVVALVAIGVGLGGLRAVSTQGQAPAAPSSMSPPPGELEILPVQNNVHAIFGAGANVTVQIGAQGPLIVESGAPGMGEKLVAAVEALAGKPIRGIVNTHMHPDHAGGNEIVSTRGGFVSGGTTGAGRRDATIYSHENVLLRMSGALGNEKLPTPFWPGNTFFNEKKELYSNGEPVELLYQPKAHTDGDIVVFFRRSDVVATGDIFDMTRFPVIDRERGGSVNGLIAALNRVLDLVIPAPTQEGGTMIVPGHGRLADEHDLLEYRDMVTIVRDRVRHMIGKGMPLDQVVAARPAMEYESRWGASSGPWTTAMFVTAVHDSLKDDEQSGGAR